MNKMLTKLTTTFIGMAMAIGVGIAVGSGVNKDIHRAEASTGSYTITFDTNTKSDGTGDSLTGSDRGDSFTTSNFATNGTLSFNISKRTYYWLCKGNTNISNVSDIANCYAGRDKTIKLGKSKEDGTLNFTVAGSSSLYIESVVVTAYSTDTSCKIIITEATDATKTWSLSTTSGSHTFSYKSQVKTVSISAGNGGTSNNKPAYISSIVINYTQQSSLTGIALSGTDISDNALSINSSDTSAHTVNVSLTPNGATDQKVNIAHQSGTSGLFTASASQITCTSGSGSFTITGTGATSGSETFRISGNTETGVYVDLEVTAIDDSTTYYTVTFNSNGGSTTPASKQVEEDGTFEFPSPGTKTHYSFLGWSSDSGTTKYVTNATSPAVTADITYTAYWQEDAKYTVTYTAGSHGTGSYAHTNQYVGSYTLLAFANLSGVSASTGYHFYNYTVGGVAKNPGDTVTITSATTITVNFDELPPQDILTKSVIPSEAVGSGTSSWGTASTFSDSTNAVYTARFMGVDGSSMIGRLNDSANGYIYTSTVPTNMKLKSVSIASMTASKTVGVYAQTGAYTAAPSNKSDAVGTITPSSLTYTFADNTNYNAICLRGHTSATEIGTVTITYEKFPELDSVTTSGQTTSFTAGNKWSYGGTLTAHYTKGKADATVTPTSFKYGDSGINPTASGTAISTSTTLDSTFNGKYVYVIYTEDSITKWASYQITINAAPATSVTLDSSEGTVAINVDFEVSSINATVNPAAYATQGVTWEVYDSDGLVENETYTFDGSTFNASEPADVVFHVKANSNASIYAEFTLSVTADPIAYLLNSEDTDVTGGSTTVFGDAGTIYYHVTTENFVGEKSYTWSSSNSSIISVDDDQDDICGFYVEGPAGSARLSCNITDEGDSDVTVYIDVSVTAVTVTSVSWTAPTINVYSGSTLSSTSGWNVKYRTNSDPDNDKTADSFKIMLGDSEITLPHTWSADDDGKTLGVQVGGVNSTTTTVSVTQTLRAVMADVPSETTYTFNSLSWGDSTSEWTGSKNGNSYVEGQGIQVTTTQSGVVVTGKTSHSNIMQIIVTYNSNKSAGAGSIELQVGSNTSQSVDVGYHSGDSDGRSMNYTAVFDYSIKQSGIIKMTVNTTTNSIFPKSVTVVTASGTTNIANATGHEAAQKAVAKFAKAFNTAMDNTSGCTTNMSSAWTAAKTAWSTFETEIASLSDSEQAYAKNLIKYATAEWTDDTDSDLTYSLERAMATYVRCVSAHGQEAFMDTIRPVAATAKPVLLGIGIANNGENILLVIATLTLVAFAFGGYTYFRKKKQF